VADDRVNSSYTSDDHAFRESDPYARAKYDLTLRWLSKRIRPAETIYNIGVGSGCFNHLAVSRGLRVLGCEPDTDAYGAAVRSAPPGTELINCGLIEFAANREPAPLVVMHDVLEHIEDDVTAARTLASIVSENGTAIVSVPALMSLYGVHDEHLGHYRRYNARTLRSVLDPFFEIRRMQWYGMASIPIAFYYSRWRRKPYPIGTTRSLIGDAYAAVCKAESYLSEPVGTSIIVEVTPRG